MSVMVDEGVWVTVTRAIRLWRNDYERAHVKVFGVPSTRPPEGDVNQQLWDASEAVTRRPPPPMAKPPEGVQLYTSGPSFQRVQLEVRKRNMRVAAQFIANDLAQGSNGVSVAVDPHSLVDTDRGIEYKLVIPETPPNSPAEAVQFFLDYGGLKGYSGDPAQVNRVLATKPSAGALRMATKVAADTGRFASANRAALLLASHYGYESSDVNPFSDNSTSPWTDVLA